LKRSPPVYHMPGTQSTSCPTGEAGRLDLKIEQLAAPPYCRAPRRPWLRAVAHDLGIALLFQPRCKSWGCDYCAAVNMSFWAATAYHAMTSLIDDNNCQNQRNLMSFLTLTSHRKLGPTASTGVFGHAWPMLSRRARRAASQGQYLLIPEQHQDGRLHVHALETFALGRRWWKDNAAQVGLGYMADEKETYSPAGAADYVTKYLTKSLSATAWPKGFRRVRTSQGWPRLPEPVEPEAWYFEYIPLYEALDKAGDDLQRAGYEVLITDHVTAWRVVNSMEN
jgi:hypothetical protein